MLLQNVQDEFAELIQQSDEQSNLMIYRNTIHSNLIQALQNTYPMIVKLVGEDFFKITADDYIAQYPSTSGNLHDYGEYFSDFLAEYSPVSDLPYLDEVAQFEWASHLLQFASDAEALDIKRLEAVDEQQFHSLRFMLHPASCLMQFDYPILRIIDLCEDEIDEDIHLDEGGVNLLLIRREFDVVLVTLSDAEFMFLSAIHNHETLGSALDETNQRYPEFKLDKHLPKWVKDKTIVDFVV